jgi:MFS family permease
MKKKQFFALFMLSLLCWTVGNGLFPVLPVFATQLGASSAQTGNYLSIGYLAVTLGTLVGGWLSDKLKRRKLLLVTFGVLITPVFWLMGQADSVLTLTVYSAGYFFCGGGFAAIISILAALHAEPAKRGRIFGLLALTTPLGTIFGGMIIGPSIDRWGYATFFSVLAFIFCFFYLLFASLVEDKATEQQQSSASTHTRVKAVLGKSFLLFFMASILISIVNFVGRMGTSLAMDQQGFALSAISIAGAVGGAVVLPILPTLGWLSDRMGRKRLLGICYLAGAVGLSTLAVSTSAWHFWVVSASLSIMFRGVAAVGPALVTDILPRRSLGRGISLFNASTWIGGIVGMGGTGHAMQGLGVAPTFLAAAFLPLVAILLLVLVRPVVKRRLAPAGS